MSRTLVWITGASAGLGAALAATVPFADPVVVDISRSGGTPRTEHLPADLADPGAWSLLQAHLLARLTGSDAERAVFVHNAAMLDPIGFAGEVDAREYARNVLLNTAAPPVLGNAFLTAVRESGFTGRCDLVMITSGAARNAYAGWSGYGAGKAALEQWVRVVGVEQREREPAVRVVAVSPGVVGTAMQERIRAADPVVFPAVERFRALHDEDRLLDPGDVARRLWELLDGELETGSVVDLRRTS